MIQQFKVHLKEITLSYASELHSIAIISFLPHSERIVNPSQLHAEVVLPTRFLNIGNILQFYKCVDAAPSSNMSEISNRKDVAKLADGNKREWKPKVSQTVGFTAVSCFFATVSDQVCEPTWGHDFGGRKGGNMLR